MARRAEMILGGWPDTETITTSSRPSLDQPTTRLRASRPPIRLSVDHTESGLETAEAASSNVMPGLRTLLRALFQSHVYLDTPGR